MGRPAYDPAVEIPDHTDRALIMYRAEELTARVPRARQTLPEMRVLPTPLDLRYGGRWTLKRNS